MTDGYKSMTDLSPAEQATKALRHFLRRSCDDPRFAWFTLGTETLALCTEAFATLTQQDVAVVRKNFLPPSTLNPAKGSGGDEDPVPKIQLSEEEVEMLEELASHHEARDNALSLAAATAGGQQAYGLMLEAREHGSWSAMCAELAERGRER